ncbi:hypothetical protein BMY_0434 [Wohlfahrtiimonas chitiniclastica]|nr:hypothetical protein [Wohlfahrtiimonas chitiniclastica]KZS22610.1 hypothetical protein BMY_0434 [Wohlfahrtiimonas chitiniclastica]
MTQSTRLLLMALLMFPQIVETLYSPILPALSSAFAISEAAAGQTLSLYFMAFAFGIVLWAIYVIASAAHHLHSCTVCVYGGRDNGFMGDGLFCPFDLPHGDGTRCCDWLNWHTNRDA